MDARCVMNLVRSWFSPFCRIKNLISSTNKLRKSQKINSRNPFKACDGYDSNQVNGYGYAQCLGDGCAEGTLF